MMLSDEEILECIEKGDLKIEPFVKSNLGPDSIDIRLGGELLICRCKNRVLDLEKRDEANEVFESVLLSRPYPLKPNQFVLGKTMEKFSIGKNLVAMLEGRSSIGRFGLVVHMTAGIVHAGFGMKEPSTLVLEMYSVNPNIVLLKPGMKIAQISLMRLGKEARVGYDFRKDSKYVKQDSPKL